MKRTRFILVALLVLFGTASVFGESYRIQVRRTVLRATASAFGAQIAALEFNTAVNVLGETGGFVQVSTAWGTGFVAKTAIASQGSFDRQYVSVKNANNYSQDAATAATKGFSDAETQESQKPGARYDLVRQALDFAQLDRADEWWRSFRSLGFLGENRRMTVNKSYDK